MRKQFKKMPVFLLALCILALQLTGALRVTAYDSVQESEEVVSQGEDETEKRQNGDGEMPDIIDTNEDGNSTSGGDESAGNESVEDESTEDDSTETDSTESVMEEDTEFVSDGEEDTEVIDLEDTETEFEEDMGSEDLVNAVAEGDMRTVYFDATLSKLSYGGSASGGSGLPTTDGTRMWCHVWVSTDAANQYDDYEMIRLEAQTKDGNTWNDVYAAEIDKKYDSILFFSGDSKEALGNLATPGTVDLTIPEESTFTNPCFYADTGDGTDWVSATKRSGYWGEAYEIRNAEAKEGKDADIVNVLDGTFNREFQTYYARVTLYDYYTDYELNGHNRDSYPAAASEVNSHRIYQPFRQFNQALSDYYSVAKAASPLYWGNFQNYTGNHFNEIQDTLKLYGYDWQGSTDTYKKFFYENNSMWGRDGGQLTASNGANATQGLVTDLLENGNLMLKTGETENGFWTKAPFFDEDFLKGKNSKNAVLGEVYHDIAFPFIQKSIGNLTTVDNTPANGTVDYWYFDSKDNDPSTSNRNLILRWDEALKLYYLESSADAVHGRKTEGVTENGNFFPLNESGQSGNAGTLNYGFAQKMEIDFRVTEDGTVSTTEGDTVPIQFNFSGDDDVWVFIDNTLVLDVGGDHGIVEGVIDFAKGNGHRKATVSCVKSLSSGVSYNVVNDLSGLMNDNFYKEDHTLTMFYMERGIWESNLYITFNFPDENRFSVEKEVNTGDVNELFDGLFDDAEFTFNIKNQATHYQTYDAEDAGGFVVSQKNIRDYGSVKSGKLENAAGALYSISDKDARVDGSGNFGLKDEETAVFVNQFRRGSYIYLEEKVDADVFRTIWELYDEGEKVTTTAPTVSSSFVSGGKALTGENTKGTTVSDGRLEKYLTSASIGVDGVANTGYTQTGPAHTENGTTDQTLVFRSYGDPDSTIGLDLKVKEINTVRTGTITVKKDKTNESEALGNEEFSFTVRFTDVAGMKLEGDTPKELTFKLKAGEEKKITGIPAGTVYTISEATSEGYTLESVKVVSGNDTAIKVGTTAVNGNETVNVSGKKGVTATGVVKADDDAANLKETLFTFMNEKSAGSIDILKKDAAGTMQGIEFTLFTADGSVAKDVDGKELKGVTASNGTLSFSKIPVGTKDQPVTYYLRETKTTSGHTLLTEQIEVTLPYAYKRGDVVNGQTVTEDGVTWHLSYTIVNDRVFILPETGQTGAGDFVFFGTMLLSVTAGALFLLLWTRRTAARTTVRQKAVSTRSGWMPKGISCQSEKDD